MEQKYIEKERKGKKYRILNPRWIDKFVIKINNIYSHSRQIEEQEKEKKRGRKR